jgi:hypothetical protein
MKWIRFSNVLIRFRDIDFFKYDHEAKTIHCHYHYGLSYEIMSEAYDSDMQLHLRIAEIKSMIGTK